MDDSIRIIPVRSIFVTSFILIANDQICLIDTGFLGHMRLISNTLATVGYRIEDIDTILLTHGHIDHTANAARIQERSKAKIYIHEAEIDHLHGRHQYHGLSKICGLFEMVGRLLSNFKPPPKFETFTSEQAPNLPAGIEVLLLPGHSAGHCGFLLPHSQTLFGGDMASRYWKLKQPPAFLNSSQARVVSSLAKAQKTKPHHLYLSHTISIDPTGHAEEFQQANWIPL